MLRVFLGVADRLLRPAGSEAVEYMLRLLGAALPAGGGQLRGGGVERRDGIRQDVELPQARGESDQLA